MIALTVTLLLVVSLTVLVIDNALNSVGRSSSSLPSVVVTKSTCNQPSGFVLIIADLSGFNDSVHHGAPLHPWPIIRVLRGQMVRLVVCNQDTTQPHGFAIKYYLDAGIAMAPGDAYRIVFKATEIGTFDIFCNIFCTIHVFMRGQLIVSE